MIVTSFALDEEKLQRLKDVAKKMDTSQGTIIRQAITKLLETYENSKMD